MKNLMFITILFLSACATPHVVDIVTPGDEKLSCAQLNIEISKLERFKNEASKEKGVTWGNAGRLIVFPIGIWATYENANKAIDAANQRRLKVTRILENGNSKVNGRIMKVPNRRR